MKKILFAIVAVAFVASLCFAQNNKTGNDNYAKSAAEVKTFRGTVEIVSWGNENSGAKPAILVANEKGEKMDFVARRDALITSKNGKTVMMTDIKKGDKVTVVYVVTSDGINRAKSIKIE